MFAKVQSMGVFALEGFCVSVEADISGGLPQFAIVGLPDNAVKEATDRVRSALKNLNFTWPVSRITVNLAPADIKRAQFTICLCFWRCLPPASKLKPCRRIGPLWANCRWMAACAA